MTPEKTEPERLISIAVAAQMLGVHKETLRRWEAEDKLKSIRTLGGHRRYRLAEIVRMQS